jgi:flagellar protein FlgJ
MNNAAIPSIFDTQSLSALKSGLRKDDPQALKAAARQFEAVFLQMVLKSMRAATPQDSMFDSEQTRFYQELLDSQLAQVMSAKGGTGLAAVIERQMSRSSVSPEEESSGGFPLNPVNSGYPLTLPQLKMPVTPAVRAYPLSPAANAVPPAPTFAGQSGGDAAIETFGSTLWPYAQAASQRTGIPPQFILAQAALETGWGKYEPRRADGQQSYNLFGIKAGSQWSGPVAEAATTEYEGGSAQKRIERFRAYNSYAEAFDDYAQLLTRQPRYAQVLESRDATGFAHALKGAGYATDPAYAEKLVRIIGSISKGMTTQG